MTDASVQLDEPALIVYDGDCIFCHNYVQMLRLRDGVGAVDLVNARTDDARVRRLLDQGYDLNEGMVFQYCGQLYYGAEAVHALALLTSPSTLFNRLNASILSSPSAARVLYPWLKRGRRVTLWMRGKSLIANPSR
jgi:predicted DCC family thiol-disulfide oxidoreductase YuxK